MARDETVRSLAKPYGVPFSQIITRRLASLLSGLVSLPSFGGDRADPDRPLPRPSINRAAASPALSLEATPYLQLTRTRSGSLSQDTIRVMEFLSLVTAASSIDLFQADAAGAPSQRTPLQTRLPDVSSSSSIAIPTPRDSDMEYSPTTETAHAARPVHSPKSKPKHVCFELISAESPQYRARLPMRVGIYPHDTTESIVTTVKNFYGLYSSPTSSKGVSFEDQSGNTLIARYENFQDQMIVYVRVTEEPTPVAGGFGAHAYHSPPLGAQAYVNGDPYPMQAPQQFGQMISRPGSRTSRRRSPSPNGGRGRRSASTSTNSKRSRSVKNPDACSDSMNGYSSGDGAPGSASGKSKEQIGNTEISVENIVEGGRRKRAKFESSELPLFAPPQMPAATSNPSVSPARRIEHHHRASLPFVHPGANPFTNPRPIVSPQSYNHTPGLGGYVTPMGDGRRTRGSIQYPSGPNAAGTGVLPTPDPTVGSCMSEEDKDVAMQLMRLGDISNISHGRNSASTQDDTFSGKADAASSTGATSEEDSESEDELPPARRQKLDSNGLSQGIYQTTESHFIPSSGTAEASGDDADYEDGSMHHKKARSSLPNGAKPRTQPAGAKPKPKSSKPKATAVTAKVKKVGPAPSGPMSPASLPASRKPSIVSSTGLPGTIGEDDQPDLSTKPRCQRCRKSKKGCDRQRPCGRCKDAGIPAELCISEDEGNGRKGRYGRHMGVPIKKEDAPAQPALLPAAPIAAAAPAVPSFPTMGGDKSKKRKR